VRNFDVLSVLSTAVGFRSLCRTAQTWIGRVVSLRGVSLAILCFFLLCFLALQGCAGLAVSQSKLMADGRQPAELPMTFRTLGPDHRFSELSSVVVADQLRARRSAEPLSILALSGGGAGSAFGAGAVAGLTHTGARPTFDVVTGVSAGALVAPYAFLGPTWDAQLIEAFTGLVEDKLLQSRGLGVIFGSSLYSGRPLQQLIDTHVSEDMILAVAREAEKGRLLLVATTDVASGQSVVWDLGAIAKNGGPSARALFRDVLVASASVPGMFPPVIIRVNEDGLAHDQAHVDGAATVPFFVPPAFLQTTPTTLGAHHTSVFVIVDGSLGEAARTTRLTARAILLRSIHVGLSHLMLTTMQLTAATAQLDGADLQYSSLPTGYPLTDSFDFSATIRRPLFRYAYECAKAGRLWTAYPRADNDNDESRSMVRTQHGPPCPADDPFFGYFATR
jgi:predicted acylesterase/phospholipase RssA